MQLREVVDVPEDILKIKQEIEAELFVKEHYPVFSVPWELLTEIQAVGVTVREVKPKMVRDLLKVASTSIVLRSVDTYVDALGEFIVQSFQVFPSSQSGLSMNHIPVVGLHISVINKLQYSGSQIQLSKA